MADGKSKTMKCDESQDESGQAQAIRLEESVMMGKGCEPQDNMQRGMGHGDPMRDMLGNVIAPGNDATKNPSSVGSNNGSSDDNNNTGTYMYSSHSLI